MLSIVIPVYNEKDSIARQLEQIEQSVGCDKEVIIVYDFAQDNTIPVVLGLRDRFSFAIELRENLYGRGALNAIKSGMRLGRGEAVLVMMADMSDDLRVVDKMWDLIANGGCDIVCGSRYMRGGKQEGGPFLKGLFSRCAGVSLHILTGIPTHDVTNSFKMYRKSFLDGVQVESGGGFEIGMELCVKAYIQGYKIAELPSYWYDRSSGESHFKMWEWIPHYLHWYWLCVRETAFGLNK